MIKRDEHGIIVQHNLNYPDQMDGGDSASRTGIMAMCGSKDDAILLSKFAYGFGGQLVRHPFQTSNGRTGEDFRNWADPKETSRDQLICWAAGVNVWTPIVNIKNNPFGSETWKYISIATIKTYAEMNFINKDFLPPHVRCALYIVAFQKPPLWIRLIAEPMMLLHLAWSAKFASDEEQNQTVCLCSIYGDEWVKRLYDWHPNLYKNLMTYWDGKPWRDQKEISEAMIKFIESKVRK